MQNPSQPIGYHCERFDIRLLEQVIALEVDTAIHRLERENGIGINAETQSSWNRTILARLTQKIFEHVDSHRLLPAMLETQLRTEIDLLLQEEISKDARPPAPIRIRRFSLLSPHVLLVGTWRTLFKKQLE